MREHVPEERREAEPVARAAPAPPVPRILALQRSAGNRAVSAMLSRQAPAARRPRPARSRPPRPTRARASC